MKYNWKDADLYKLVYEKNPEYGKTGVCKLNVVSKYINDFQITSVWDYGCGPNYAPIKELRKNFPKAEISGYDPAIIVPNDGVTNNVFLDPVDFIVSTDCLEHLWEDEIEACLDIFDKKYPRYIYLAICTRKAGQILPDGTNAHKTVQPADWWEEVIKKHLPKFWIVEKEVISTTQHANFLLKRGLTL